MADMDYFEVVGVGMFLDREDPNPRHAVHLVRAGEKVRPEYELPSPQIDEREELSPGLPVVSLAGLVRMKLLAGVRSGYIVILPAISHGGTYYARESDRSNLQSRQ